ncbi:MAG TPA: hypothetical protein VNG33_10160, partial [Polyangiaceae bacterium]|nr:hypothetical protein [Polyangiaceae bacterium]
MMARLKWLTTGAALLATHGAFAADSPSTAAATSAAPEAAATPAAATAPTQTPATAPAEDLTTKLGGWTVTLYGQVAVNAMHDSTQSFGVSSGNSMLQRRGTFRGNNDQLQLTSKDSRVGLRINLPDYGSIKSLAVVETDFGATLPVESTENATYIQTPLRMRLFYLQLQTPVVDLTAGQMQDLFGWGGKGFFPNTLAFQGITGQVYHRQTAVRISKTLRPGALELEAAVAATRPVQR